MDAVVLPQIVGSGEGLAADGAQVRPLAGVAEEMHVQAVLLGEGLRADVAHERPLGLVAPRVRSQLVVVGELLVALSGSASFFFCK